MMDTPDHRTRRHAIDDGRLGNARDTSRDRPEF